MTHFIQFSGDSEPGSNHSSVHQDSLDPGQTDELYSVPLARPSPACLAIVASVVLGADLWVLHKPGKHFPIELLLPQPLVLIS